MAALAERLAALSRAGLPLVRAWAVLAGTSGRWTALATIVRRTLELGGTSAEGLQDVVPGGGPLAWLALTCAVSDQSPQYAMEPPSVEALAWIVGRRRYLTQAGDGITKRGGEVARTKEL